MAKTSESETVDRLRSDSGRTGDKAVSRDPAAAPLGTDDEAAGMPGSPRQVNVSRQQALRGPHSLKNRNGPGYAWILIGIVAVLALAAGAWVFVGVTKLR